MESLIFPVVDGLAALTLASGIFAVILLIDVLVGLLTRNTSRLTTWISAHGLGLMLTVALVATLGSLFLSEIAGWTPCKKCWLQRIVMYPQVVLLAIALWKKDRKVAMYVFVLSLIGILIATDHYIEQVMAAIAPANADPNVPCDETGVSCAATNITFRFGYITIPMMALTAFVLNTFGSLAMLRAKKLS